MMGRCAVNGKVEVAVVLAGADVPGKASQSRSKHLVGRTNGRMENIKG